MAELVDGTERQWNSFFSEVMGRDSFGRVAGSYMEFYSVVQRALNQGMERYLNTFNLPRAAASSSWGSVFHNVEASSRRSSEPEQPGDGGRHRDQCAGDTTAAAPDTPAADHQERHEK